MKKLKKQKKLKKPTKRGDISIALIAVVLAIAGLVVTAPIAIRLVAGTEERTQDKVCEQSVAFRARSQLNVAEGIATVSVAPLLCKTQEKHIVGNREELKEQISMHLASCWQMFGAGKYEEILSGFTSSLLPESHNQCFVCYTLIVDQNEIEGGDITPDELIQYLLNAPYPRNQQVTYLEHLQSAGRGTVAYLATDNEGKVLPIKPRTGYSISFAPKLKEIDDSAIWKRIALATGSIAGVFVLGAVTSGVGWIALGGIAATTLIGGSAYSTVKAAFIGERIVSSIYLDTLPSAQANCYAGDLASVLEE